VRKIFIAFCTASREKMSLFNLIDFGPAVSVNQVEPTNPQAAMLLTKLDGADIRSCDGTSPRAVAAFLESLEKLIIQRPKMPVPELIRMAIYKCSGHAYRVVRNLDPETTSLATFRTALELGCGVCYDINTAEANFSSCRQEPNEQTSAYYQRLSACLRELELCGETIEGETDEVRQRRYEARLSRTFEAGLRQHLATAVRASRVTTMAEKLQVALREEAAFKAVPRDDKTEMIAAVVEGLKNTFLTQPGSGAHSGGHLQQLQQQQYDLQSQQGAAGPHNQYEVKLNHHEVNYNQYGGPGGPPIHQGPQQYFQPQQQFGGQRHQGGHNQRHYGGHNQRQYGGQNQRQFGAPNQQYPPRQRTPIQDVVCYTCHQKGHYARNCDMSNCTYCGSSGHSVKACPTLPCSICKQVGHTYDRCPKALPPPAGPQAPPPANGQRSITYYSKN